MGFQDQQTYYLPEQRPRISRGSWTDTKPQFKPDERWEKGSLVDTLPFLAHYSSERFTREGRTLTSTNHPGESFS